MSNIIIIMNYSIKSSKETQLFLKLLKEELSMDLPGVSAHIRLAPEIRIQDLKTGITPPQAMQSAVLIILYAIDGMLNTVVILRNEYDGAHSGQISLPGGKKEETDRDFEHTALREAQEEIGINPAETKIIGQLSPFYVRPSNFIIYPYIAFCKQRPVFQPDSLEVQRIIEIEIFKEIGYDKIENKMLTFKNNNSVNAPGFIVGGEFMWGATAMIFSELLHVLDQAFSKMKAKNKL